MRVRHHIRGFTLLEALVAMTIFSMSAMGLYAWINTMLIGTNRIDDILNKNEDVTNAIEYMRTVNPMQQPAGTVQLGEVEVSWQSELIEPVHDGVQVPLFRFGLFDVELAIQHADRSTRTLSLRQVGYLKREGVSESF